MEYRTDTQVNFLITTRRAVQLPWYSARSNLSSLAESLDLSLPHWYGNRIAALPQGHTLLWGILSLSYTVHGKTSPVHQDLQTVTCWLNFSELHMGPKNLDLFFLHHYTRICAHRTDRLQAGHLLLRLQLLLKPPLHFSHITKAPVSSRTIQGILLGCNRRDIILLFLSSLSIILLLSNSGLLGTFSEYQWYTKSKNY